MSRSVIPGDIVRRLEKGKETQRGYCKEAKKTVTVQIVGTDKVIEHVAGNRIKSIRPYDVDDAVCLDTKFGRIEALDQEVTLLSKCGSVVKILTSINHDIDDYWLLKRNRCLFEACYPGQELVATPSNFEQPEWIKKTKTMKRNIQNRQRFTVQNVKDSMVEVAWYGGEEGNTSATTIQELKAEEIEKLHVLEETSSSNTYLELASRCMLKINHSDIMLKKKDWIKKLSSMYRGDVTKRKISCDSRSFNKVPKIRSSSLLYSCLEHQSETEEDWCTDEDEGDDESIVTPVSTPTTEGEEFTLKTKKCYYPPKPKDLLPGNLLPVEILCVQSKATIVWQDGTEESNIPTTQLYYSTSLDDHEFFPGEWVVKDLKVKEGDSPDVEEYGAVQNVNYLERTAAIKWFTYDKAQNKPVELGTNEMSVYDLKKHPKFVFRPNSVVKTIPAQENKLGRVIDSCPEGYVIVKWISGMQLSCWPQEIEVIPDAGDFDMTEMVTSDEDDDPNGSWETESIETYAGDLNDETTLQNMAARLDFIRNRIIYLKQMLKEGTFQDATHVLENFGFFTFLKDLLLVYDNFSYLDRLLGTSFFSLKSKHFQAVLNLAKEKAKASGMELRGRLFSNDNLYPSTTKTKVAERDNINKVLKLENMVNARMEEIKEDKDKGKTKESSDPTKSIMNTTISEPLSPEIMDVSAHASIENLCIELLSMLKIRMDLAYAEIISKIGGPQVASILTNSIDSAILPARSTPLPSLPTTPDDSFSSLSPPKLIPSNTYIENESYRNIEEVPKVHFYATQKVEVTDQQKLLKAVHKEYKLLRESLPPGVWVRTFGNRIDLLSVMIRGPAKTPYEDGLFLFDIQLSSDYPRSPPLVHYISYSSERLNPNLYVEGKVCISLLGTWMGRGTEVWGPNSTLLQLIVSIQGLILVSEPYYNEAGYEKRTDTQQGYENSRTYNELVILKLVQSMTELLLNPPEIFKQEILSHFALNGKKLCQRLQRFCSESDPLVPEFPLLPVSKGLKLSLAASLNNFQDVLKKVITSNNEESIS